MAYSLFELEGVAKTLVSLHKRGVLHLAPAFIADLEREMGFPEKSLDNAVDKILVPRPKVEIIGMYYKVYHNNLIYYIRSNIMPVSNITTEYMDTRECYQYTDIIINVKNKSFLKNRFGIQQIIDLFVENPLPLI